MEVTTLSKFPQKGDHLRFCDEVKDDLQVTGATLWACHFRRIGAKSAVFEKSSLTQCLFEDTYLRSAHFSDVRLTGSTFRNCNLEKASFRGCDLRYCTFQTTRVDRDEIISNLPVEPNLKRDLARNLRKNYEALGDKESADVLLDLEIEAHEQELFAAFCRKTEYYRSHYNGIDQLLAGMKYFRSRLSGMIWGYGHRVRRLVTSYISISLVFALITYFYRLPFIVDAKEPVHFLGFWESIYYTFAGTLGIGTALTPVTAFAKALQLCQGFLGTLFLALLAAAAYRRIAR